MIGEIKRYIRDDGPIKVSRSIKELGIKIRELQRMYLNKKGHEVKIEELQKELKVSKEDITLALEVSKGIESIENATFINSKNGNRINLIEKISTDKNEEEIITNRIVVKELINGLEQREKQVIMLRFFKDKTQEQVAKILGVTQVQVSRIERRVLNQMKQKLSS